MRPYLALLLPALLAAMPGNGAASECRLTMVDGFMGVDANGTPNAIGLSARVDSYYGDGFLATLGGSEVSNVDVRFSVITPEGRFLLGDVSSDRKGWAELDLDPLLIREGDDIYVSVVGPTGPTLLSLTESQHLQVVAEAPGTYDDCDGGLVHPDVYGSLFFRHPLDDGPILFSDLDDTLFNSSDLTDWIREVLLNHYAPLDSAVVDATHSFRAAGGTFIGITAQPKDLRPFTRSELLFWGFDAPYEIASHYYEGLGYDGTFLPRTLSYLANDEYEGGGLDMGYQRDHCAYKVQKFDQMVNGVFGGHWEQVVGIIGDSQHSDGCAAFESGIHWYALMEEGTAVDPNDSESPPPSPSAYTEISGGWSEALPIVCADSGLTCTSTGLRGGSVRR